MFKSSKKKSTAAKLVKQMDDLEQLCFSALQIDANILGAFDRRFHLRLEAYEKRMDEMERRLTAMETLLDLNSQPGSFVAGAVSDNEAASPHTPLSQLGAVGGAPKDEGHFTFEAGVAPSRQPPPRPPSWSAESIEAFLSRSFRMVESDDDKKEWLRIVQSMSPSPPPPSAANSDVADNADDEEERKAKVRRRKTVDVVCAYIAAGVAAADFNDKNKKNNDDDDDGAAAVPVVDVDDDDDDDDGQAALAATTDSEKWEWN